MNSKKILKSLLLLGSIYFFIVAIVHFLGVKIPMLYIYYDVESTIYQDRIIAVLSFVFSTFLFAAYKLLTITLQIVKYVLIAGFIGVLGLAINNFLTNIAFRINLIYWLEIAFLGLYIMVLTFLYYKILKKM
ncbi:MAG TPA: hypothetical protein EYG89_00510 [Bacteroidia bacterium]|nr:hypothetical protein [Bacteroidia bacterium]